MKAKNGYGPFDGMLGVERPFILAGLWHNFVFATREEETAQRARVIWAKQVHPHPALKGHPPVKGEG